MKGMTREGEKKNRKRGNREKERERERDQVKEEVARWGKKDTSPTPLGTIARARQTV